MPLTHIVYYIVIVTDGKHKVVPQDVFQEAEQYAKVCVCVCVVLVYSSVDMCNLYSRVFTITSIVVQAVSVRLV